VTDQLESAPKADLAVRLTVNGTERALRVPAHRSLLDALRDDLALTGAKECCAVGECGACTVLVDGRTVNSCLMLAVEADGATVTTVEGLAPAPGRLSALQDAFLEQGAVQCGFCIPGMLVSARQLLDTTPDPSVEDIREGLSGNLCRCAGYNRIVAAVTAAAEQERRSATAVAASGGRASDPRPADDAVDVAVSGQVEQ
jgi:aerobic-type carbon monoxide dehydrogenase small subunit (CoxS/CutS family)